MRLAMTLVALLLGATGCKSLPDDGRYQGYGTPNRGEAGGGLPVTPYDPYSR